MINIFNINKDILSVTEGAVMHGCNIECTFGAGLALAIKKKWPEAYREDLLTGKGDVDKLGGVTFTSIADSNLWVFNLYQQSLKKQFKDGRALDYNAFYEALYEAVRMCRALNIKNVYLPYGIGCGLARGKWSIIHAMIKEIFSNQQDLVCWICKL